MPIKLEYVVSTLLGVAGVRGVRGVVGVLDPGVPGGLLNGDLSRCWLELDAILMWCLPENTLKDDK